MPPKNSRSERLGSLLNAAIGRLLFTACDEAAIEGSCF